MSANGGEEKKAKKQLVRELVLMRAKVTDSHRLLAELLRSYKEAPIGLCVFDLDLRYEHINKWLADINGVPVEEHIGRTVREVLPHIAEIIEPQLRQVIETGESITGGGGRGGNPGPARNQNDVPAQLLSRQVRRRHDHRGELRCREHHGTQAGGGGAERERGPLQKPL